MFGHGSTDCVSILRSMAGLSRSEAHNRYRARPRSLFSSVEVEQGKRVERPCDARGHDKRSLRSRGTSRRARTERSIPMIPARYTRHDGPRTGHWKLVLISCILPENLFFFYRRSSGWINIVSDWTKIGGLIAVKSLKKLVSWCNYTVYDVFYERREITHRNDYIILYDLGKSW